MLTPREVECLLVIYLAGDLVSPSDLAGEMGITRVSALEMLRRLSEKGCGDYIERRGLILNEHGRKLAENHIRKHRLIETFLHRSLAMPLEDACREARRIDYYMSDDAVERMDAILGHPGRCPHGYPIPEVKEVRP